MADGELFSRLYGERGAPTQDNARFRMRLFGFLEGRGSHYWSEMAAYFRSEVGVSVEGHYDGFAKFLNRGPIADVLDFLTAEFRRLSAKYDGAEPSMKRYYAKMLLDWVAFVQRALNEENLGYQFTQQGGIRYFVDEEFERNRVSALAALQAPQLQAVRDAYESAHRYLDPGARDTKASVRDAFEALEILAKLTYPSQSNLSKSLILQKFRVGVQAHASDEIAKKAIDAAFKGIAEIVDGGHSYRHGQPVEETVSPPLDYAVFFLSSVASTIRYVVPLWAESQGDPTGAAVAQALAKRPQPR